MLTSICLSTDQGSHGALSPQGNNVECYPYTSSSRPPQCVPQHLILGAMGKEREKEKGSIYK